MIEYDVSSVENAKRYATRYSVSFTRRILQHSHLRLIKGKYTVMGANQVVK